MFEYNNGVRDHYEYKDAMFTNSLFKDYLSDHGLDVWKGESTRDIICLEFNYGSRSYQQELHHLRKVSYAALIEYRRAKMNADSYLIEKSLQKIYKINDLMRLAHKNKKCYHHKTCGDLREYYYVNGVDVYYSKHIRGHDEPVIEKIHYKMLYRSTGKAKKGSCMFINEKLYDLAINFLRMGIKIDDDNPMLVEISAYSPLVSSGIVDKVRINPRNILILKDIDIDFITNVVSVELDSNKHCVAKRISDYKLKNTLFDGQALIDSSIFPADGNGYILLRHHFCKMAAFNTNIQKFFKDYFKENYDTATITDMFGYTHYVKDIELITTDNAMKWIKFNKTYEYWCEWVEDNDCMFGIVKTAHASKLGNYQRMSYQMVNSLDQSIMSSVASESVAYIERLKSDIDFFVEYLRKNSNFSNDYDVLVALYEQNHEFARSTYFRQRRKKIIETYVLKFKSGEILQDAENLTIVGSPYAMLLYAAIGNPDNMNINEIADKLKREDDTFAQEPNAIQCYTERFNSGEYLAGFRSPFNSKNNLTHLHNNYSKKFEKYFNFGKQVIAVNMIGTDFQDRNNGADQDSDFLYTTNQTNIVKFAEYCYNNYPTIVNNIPKDKQKYENSLKSFALIDNILAKSQLDIGESSNLAQIAQTYSCNFDDPKYADYVCILSVLAQVAIDNSKRKFDVDVSEEIKRIKNDLDVRHNKYPEFWAVIKKGFKAKNVNYELKCPMNFLCSIKTKKITYEDSALPMSYFFVKDKVPTPNKKTNKKIEQLITVYSLGLLNNNTKDASQKDREDYLLLRSNFDKLIQSIRESKISGKYRGLMLWLLDRAFNITPDVSRNNRLKTKLSLNKVALMRILYEVNREEFLKCFSSSSE